MEVELSPYIHSTHVPWQTRPVRFITSWSRHPRLLRRVSNRVLPHEILALAIAKNIHGPVEGDCGISEVWSRGRPFQRPMDQNDRYTEQDYPRAPPASQRHTQRSCVGSPALDPVDQAITIPSQCRLPAAMLLSPVGSLLHISNWSFEEIQPSSLKKNMLLECLVVTFPCSV